MSKFDRICAFWNEFLTKGHFRQWNYGSSNSNCWRKWIHLIFILLFLTSPSDAIAYEMLLLYVYQKKFPCVVPLTAKVKCTLCKRGGYVCACECLTAYKVAAYTNRIFNRTSAYCQGAIKFSGNTRTIGSLFFDLRCKAISKPQWNSSAHLSADYFPINGILRSANFTPMIHPIIGCLFAIWN